MTRARAVSTAWRPVLRATYLTLWMLLGGCASEPAQLEDPDGTLDDIIAALRSFGIANEFYYAEHGSFTADVGELQSQGEWAPDSVELNVEVTDDQQGWSALVTHVRTGPGVGCVMVWGNAPTIETPQGVPHDGSNLIVCDDVFDTATDRYGVAPPRR